MGRDLSSYPPLMLPTATFINHSYCYYRHHLLQPASWALTFTSFNNKIPPPHPHSDAVTLFLSLPLLYSSFSLHLLSQVSLSSAFPFPPLSFSSFPVYAISVWGSLIMAFCFFSNPPPPTHYSPLSEWHTPGEEISSGLAAKKKLNKAFLQGDCSVSVCVYVWVCSDGMLIKDDVILHCSRLNNSYLAKTYHVASLGMTTLSSLLFSLKWTKVHSNIWKKSIQIYLGSCIDVAY